MLVDTAGLLSIAITLNGLVDLARSEAQRADIVWLVGLKMHPITMHDLLHLGRLAALYVAAGRPAVSIVKRRRVSAD